MENQNEITTVPRVVFEAEMARWERVVKRIVFTFLSIVLVLIVLLVGTNLVWAIYESQFEDVSWSQEVEQSADGDGNNNFVGGDYYGNETTSKDDG